MDFPFSCTIAPYITEDKFHKITYGTAITSICNYEELTEINEDETITSAWVAIPPGTAVSKTSKIILSSGNTNKITSFKKITHGSDGEIEYIRIILGNPLKWGDL